jgi:quercetin dioxygenase-like cupin family protein
LNRARFDAGAAFTPKDDRLSGVTIAPLTLPVAQGSTAQVAVFRISAGGGIWRHPATAPQILAVIEGSGEVSGGDGVFHPIGAGEAVSWTAGEEHETRTSAGLTALIVEGAGIVPCKIGK